MKYNSSSLWHDAKSDRDVILVEKLKTDIPFWIAKDYDFETFLIVCEYNLEKVKYGAYE